MAFVKTRKEIEIGDRVKTTKIHRLEYGYFEKGTEVTVTGYLNVVMTLWMMKVME